MSKTHTFNPSVTTPSGSISGTAQTFTGGKHVELDETFAIGTDVACAFALDVSKLQSIFMVASTALTIQTNNGTTPDDTINLVAGIPYIWNTNSYDACLLTTDITSTIYITNAASSRLQISAIVDPT